MYRIYCTFWLLLVLWSLRVVENFSPNSKGELAAAPDQQPQHKFFGVYVLISTPDNPTWTSGFYMRRFLWPLLEQMWVIEHEPTLKSFGDAPGTRIPSGKGKINFAATRTGRCQIPESLTFCRPYVNFFDRQSFWLQQFCYQPILALFGKTFFKWTLHRYLN